MGLHSAPSGYSVRDAVAETALSRARAALRSNTALSVPPGDLRKRGALVFDSLEKRYLLSADISPYADALDDGLDRLQVLVDDLQDFAQFAADIPLLGESLAEAAQLAETLETELLDPLRNAIATVEASATGTFQDLNAAVDALGAIQSTLSESGAEAKLQIAFDKTVASGGHGFDFGEEAALFGLAIGADFDFNLAIAFDFTLGVLLDTSLAPSQAVFIENGADLTVSGSADLEAAAAGQVVKVGLLGGASLDAASTFALKASATATLSENPVGDGRITLAELDAGGLALVATQVNAAGTGFTASLKLDSAGSISGLNLVDAGVTITLDGDFFSNPRFDISIDTPQLADFTRLNGASLLSFLGDLGGKLETLASAFDALGQIDFIDLDPSDLSNFNAALRNVIDSLSVPGLLGGALADLGALTAIGNQTFGITVSTLDPATQAAAVDVTKTITLDFTAIDSLVDAASDKLGTLATKITDALDAAFDDLTTPAVEASPIEAFVRDGFIGLRARENAHVVDFALGSVAAPISALLGFQTDHLALPIPTFETIQQFAAKLAALDIFDGTGANLTYDPTTKSLKFDLDIGFDAVAFERTLGFNQALSLGLLGELALAGSADVEVGADMGFALDAGFDLTQLTGSVLLSRLNGGLGVGTNPSGQPDLLFVTRDGSAASVDLSGVTTIAGLMTAVSTGTGGKVTVSIDPLGSGLILTDTTTPVGAAPIFSVSGGAFSNAAYDLGFGFGGVASPGTATIAGGAVVDRFFIGATSKASAGIGIEIDDVDLFGAIGFLSVEIEDGGTTAPIGFALDLQLKDVRNADGLGRLYLSELAAQERNDQSGVAFDGTGISFKLDLADGTSSTVDLAGATTVGAAVALIDAVSGVDAFLNDTGTAVILVDRTAGTGVFKASVLGAEPGAEVLGFKLSNPDVNDDGILRGDALVAGSFAALDSVDFDGGVTGTLVLPIAFEDGGAFGLDDAGFTLTVTFANATGSIVPSVSTTGLEDLIEVISDLGAADLLTLVRQIAGVVFDRIDLLNADLPLLDGSIGDLVALVQDRVDDVVGPATDRINELLVHEVDRLLAYLNPQNVAGVKQAVIDSGFFADDPAGLAEFNDFTALSSTSLGELAESDAGHLLIDALEELRAQVVAFGGVFDFLFSDAPTKLIAAFAAVRGALQGLREEFSTDTAFLGEIEDRFGESLRSIEEAIPSTRTILKLVQEALGFELPRLDDTLGNVEDKLSTELRTILKALGGLDDAGLEAASIADLVDLAADLIDGAGDQLGAKVDSLKAELLAIIDAADGTVDGTDDIDDLLLIPGTDAADVALVQEVLDILDDAKDFLTDGSYEDGLAKIVLKLKAIAASGEDIFDLVAAMADITRFIDGVTAKVEVLTGGKFADLRTYLKDTVGKTDAFLDDKIGGLAQKAFALAESAVEEFRATVLGFFGGGLLQFDYDGGLVKANLSIAPSLFEVDVSGVDFNFSAGGGLFNAGIEDGALSFALGGRIDLGLALQLGAAPGTFGTDFDLLVSADTGFRLEAELAVNGALFVNLGGVGVQFAQKDLSDQIDNTVPSFTLTNLSESGPAFFDLSVTGTATDGYISLSDLGFAATAEARLKGQTFAFTSGLSPMLITWDDDADGTTDAVGVDLGILVDILFAGGEFAWAFDANALEAGEIEAIFASLTEFNFANILAAFDLVLDFLIDATDSLGQAPIIGGPSEGLNDLLESFRSAYDGLRTGLESLDDDAADLVAKVQALLFGALQPFLDADAMKANGGDVNLLDAEDILLDWDFDATDRSNASLVLEPLVFGFTVGTEADPEIVPFDFGLDAFVVEVASEGGVEVHFDLNLAIGFGISMRKGAFLVLPDFDGDNVVDPILTGEFKAQVTEDTSLNLRLFFLGVEATPWVGLTEGDEQRRADMGLSVADFIAGGHNEDAVGEGVGFYAPLTLGLLDETGAALSVSGADETAKGHFMLSVLDLGDVSLDVDFGFEVNIDLHLEGGPDFGGALAIGDLPNIRAEMNVDWMWSAGEGELEKPGVQFYDLRLDIGEWAENALKPLLDFIDDFTAPLDPFLEFLDAEVPILSQLSELFGQGPVTVLDAIRLLGSGVESIEIFLQIVETIKAVSGFIDTLSAGTLINFGDFIVTDPYGVTGAAAAETAGLDLSQLSARADLGDLNFGTMLGVGASSSEVSGAIDDASDPSGGGGGLSGIFDTLRDIGLNLPFLEDPTLLFGLLMGQRIDFVVWDIPRLAAEFGISYKFGPILPPVPLFVTLGGGFEIFLDLSVGYDSRGLETGSFTDGFFFGDFAYDSAQNKFLGDDILELGLKVFFEATASLSVVVAEAGVTGGVEAEIGANWADDDGDGKFYLDEIEKKLAEGILCIFDFQGALTAYLEAFVKLGFDTPFGFVTIFEDSFELLRVTLLDFSVSCPPLPPPSLATLDDPAGDVDPTDTTARLNIGVYAPQRQPGADGDADEKIEIFGDRGAHTGDEQVSIWADGGLAGAIAAGYFRNDGKLTHSEARLALAAGFLNGDLDLNGDGDIDADEIRAVRDLDGAASATGNERFALLIGFGEWELFNNVTLFYGDAGGGDDQILGHAESLEVALHVMGGAGEDELLGGLAADVLLGGAGDDIVRGFGGADSLAGDGRATAAASAGLTVDDWVTSAGTDGADNVFGGDGADRMYGGGAADTLKGDGEDDTAASGDAGDWIYGNAGEDAITGHLGRDFIFGGQGADNIDGGAGDDVIRGDIELDFNSAESAVRTSSPNSATGEIDLILGGEGADFIRGDGGNDIIFGESDGFVLGSISHATLGDVIHGDGGDDVIRGQYGDDTISGGDGADLLVGGAGGDRILGNAGADTIWGDLLPADLLPAVLSTQQSSARDRIEGGAGADTIRGQEDDDWIIGGLSSSTSDDSSVTDAGDLIFGGAGHDVILGDDGSITGATAYATNATGTGGNDTIHGEAGDDQIAGGRGADLILGDEAGAGPGEDILFGDEIVRNGLSLIGRWNIAGTDGADLILGYAGSDLIVGGGAGDTAYGGIADDLIAGDYAQVMLKDTSVGTLFQRVAWAQSLDPGKGAADRLFGEAGEDIAIGGDGGDLIHGGSADAGEDDILLGDHALVVRDDGSAFANDIFSIFGNVGGTDTIHAGGGADIVIGGHDDDAIFGGSADDVILGDAGLVLRDGDAPPDVVRVISTFAGIEVAGIPTAPSAFAGLDLGLDAADPLAQGNDDIDAGAGNDVALGGLLSDLIYGRDGSDVALGDNGEVLYTGSGSGLPAIVTVRTRGTNGGIDAIFGEAGRDVAFGGAAGDFVFGDLTAAPTRSGGSFTLPATFTAVIGADDDTLAGDFGELTVQGGTPVLLSTTDPAAGGRDLIEGHEGDDVLIGGAESDALHGDAASARIAKLIFGGTDNTGSDIVIGDGGLVDWIDSGDADASTIDLIRTLDPGHGAADLIFGNNGEDILIGGFGGDRIYGDRTADVDLGALSISNEQQFAGNGYDRILGDNGLVDFVIAGDSVAGRADIPVAVAFTVPTILISSTDPTLGGNDLILGDGQGDLIFGGTGSDRIWGDDGGTFGAGVTPAGGDVILGDHGKAWQTVGLLGRSAPWVGDDYFAIFTGALDGGAGDVIFGEAGDDVAMGQQGDDVVFGGAGQDDLIGGHNTAGGSDDLDGLNAVQLQAILGAELSHLDPTDLQDVNDILDGGAGEDVIAGDNAIVQREGVGASDRFRTLDGSTLYRMVTGAVPTVAGTFAVDLGFLPNIGTAVADPSALLPRNVFLLDFDAAVEAAAAAAPGAARPFGDDVIVGGSDDDVIFGQLGDDIIQGDGTVELVDRNTADGFDPAGDPTFVVTRDALNVTIAPTPVLPVTDADLRALRFVVAAAATDGDDYVEGNGGNDRIYGNLGQDDLIGGSSELASKELFSERTDEGLRPDGADLIYGGAGDPQWLARNADIGGTDEELVGADNANVADADFIVGDNANIYRLVEVGTFAYAAGTGYGTGTGALQDPLRVRVVELLDYEHSIAAGVNPLTGTVDWKTTFNDFGVGAGDLIHGESGDDVIFGMTGDDLLHGEAGNDDIYGQAGADVIFGGLGVDGILGDDGLLSTSRNGLTEPLIGLTAPNLQEIIRTPGNLQIELIHRTGELLKTADMIAFDLDGVTFAIAGEPDPQMTSANDIIFGGWDDDFIHSGFGDDAVSGAEALEDYYLGGTAVNDFLRAQQDTGPGSPAAADDPFWYGFGLYNPGDVLRFGARDPAEFALYDENDPRSRIMVTETVNDLSETREFLLNNDATDGRLDRTFTMSIETDGADKLFGDLGNDWIVGGTGRDHMFGGRGSDLIQMDDDLSTGSGANRKPDAYQEYADIAFDGAGRDYLILNTGADRAISWVGEFNSFIVPFSPFGAFQIARLLQPQTEQFVLDLAEAAGSDRGAPDILRFAEQIAIDGKLANPLDPAVYAERRGAPFDELGMVRQEDFDWTDQSGPPDDPQAGNDKGPRDVMRRELWLPDDNQTAAKLAKAESEEWYLVEMAFAEAYGVNNVIEIAGLVKLAGTQMLGTLGDADDTWGTVEIQTKIELSKFGRRDQANGYVLFDVVDAKNFKFAGLNVSGDRIVIGEVVNGRWVVVEWKAYDLRAGAEYNLVVTLSDDVVRVTLDGVEWLVRSFRDSVVDGGYGLAATGVQANFKATKITGALAMSVVDESVEAVAYTEPSDAEPSSSTVTSSMVATTSDESTGIDWGTTTVVTSESTASATSGSALDLGTASPSGGTIEDSTGANETQTSSKLLKRSENLVVVEAWMPRDDFATGTMG